MCPLPQGLAQLYQFRETHPDATPIIERFLEQTGDFFRGYIARGLAAMAEERKLNSLSPRARSYMANAERKLCLSSLRVSDARAHACVHLEAPPVSNPAATSTAFQDPGAYRLKLERMQSLFNQHRRTTEVSFDAR